MLKHRLERQALDLEEEGVSHEEAEIQAKAKEDEFRRAIERNSRGWFLVEKIAKKEKIFCLEDDVDQVIQGLAREHGAQPSAVRKYYEEKHMLGELRMEIIERKVCEFLLDQAKITDEEGDPASSAIAEDAGEES
jgi:trigger factor